MNALPFCREEEKSPLHSPLPQPAHDEIPFIPFLPLLVMLCNSLMYITQVVVVRPINRLLSTRDTGGEVKNLYLR